MKLLLLVLITAFSFNSFAQNRINETPRKPYGQAIQEGKVLNSNVAHGFFGCENLTTSVKTVWNESGLYVWPSVASQMTVSSSSANDTSAGSGAQTVVITGLDGDYNPIEEEITLNGQTPVTTTNSFLRIQGNGMRVTAVGASEFNEGNIYIGTGTVTAGVPANVYNLISINENRSTSGFYTVPAGFKGYFYNLEVSSISNKPLKIAGYVRNGIPAFFKFTGFFVDGYVDSKPPFPDAFEEKSDIEFRAVMDSGTGEVNAHAHLLLIK